MHWKISEKLGVILLLLGFCASTAAAQAPNPLKRQIAPATPTSIDGSEAMFTTMCALYAAGYESGVSPDNWGPYRAQMRERLSQQRGPAVDALKTFYRRHQLRDPGEMLSRYVWFGLVSGPAPKFQPVMRRDELPPDVLELEGFSEILSNYYQEQNIGALWKQVQPLYDREIQRLHDPVSDVLMQASTYLRVVPDPSVPRTFTVVVEPLVGVLTNVRSFGDRYAIVLSGNTAIPIDMVRHAYLHYLLDPLATQYLHVEAVKRPLYEMAAKAPRLEDELKDDFPSWFGECNVRAVEVRLKRLSASEQEVALNNNDEYGYVLVRPIFQGLTGYEQNPSPYRDYYPDLIRGIDLSKEQTRVAAIHYAPAPATPEGKNLSGEAPAGRRPRVTTVPDDQQVIAELTEGEKKIAAKDPRAAAASFQSVLAKYPDQPRAWYGLGLVALLDHDADKAKEVFGRLTAGDNAASKDPMVLAWSHVYLGRIFEDEGQLEKAKTEYQAVLAVQGAPAQAQQAAQKGLGELDLMKPSERP